MGVRILHDPDERQAVLYDSVTMWAFGPLLADYEDAEAFLQYVGEHDGHDARQLTDSQLEHLFGHYREDYPID